MAHTQPPAPFSCVYTPNIPELLHQLGCTIAISTYQAGKVIMMSADSPEKLIQLPRSFSKAMGLALDGRKLAIATKDEVLVLANSVDLAEHYPRQPHTYDALFMPRATYYTGNVDIHDLDWGANGGLFAVNTSFSCLIEIDDNYSFTPYWQPPFINKLASEDRCHLNGMTMVNGLPKYVTAFGTGNTVQSWRDTVTTGGIIMDVDSNEMVATEVPMPHSPRLYNGELYVLLSATGELAKVDIRSGKRTTVNKLKGFVRGLSFIGDYAFVGLSRLRRNSSTFAKLPIAADAQYAGISVIHMPTGALVGEIRYQASVDEIYDVQIFPEMTRPNLLNTQRPEFRLGLDIPGATYWARVEEGES